MQKDLSTAVGGHTRWAIQCRGNFCSSKDTDGRKTLAHLLFASRVSRASTIVLAGPATEFQPISQLYKRSRLFLGHFFC
jgi:hypothetical protein